MNRIFTILSIFSPKSHHMEIIYLVTAMLAGAATGWLLTRAAKSSDSQKDRENAQLTYNALDKEFTVFKAKAEAQLQVAEKSLQDKLEEFIALKEEKSRIEARLDVTRQELADEKAGNRALLERLENQKKEMEELGKKFNTEFENIANRILEVNTGKFTELNKSNMHELLKPLGENISEFKKTVTEVYDKESKERFSLAEKVKELAKLNQTISEEARNLTQALKGETQTQGRWGEMILESILEKSGLRKDEEYFLQEQLTGADGKPLTLDGESKKMRPDALVRYPDNRSVIIDSKVSLNAFTRYIDAEDDQTRQNELGNHVRAVKSHIVALSSRGYDDYDKSLDFVMMFLPSEPAYMAALKGDPDIWNFAYEKRILLINPTNLIIALKLIADLWKREYQNRNALDIAERGAKLYDKFVGFVKNMESVGASIDKAKESWSDAHKQLSTGKDNLVLQANKLKNLGLKTKKELAAGDGSEE